MASSGLIDPGRLRELFDGVEHDLFRFPTVDPARLRKAVDWLGTTEHRW